MPRPRRLRDETRRRRAFREPLPRLLIVCEGQKTEPLYFQYLRRRVRSVLVEIDDRSGVPKTLVERAVARVKEANAAAKSMRDVFQKFDEVWCVFDVDAHPRLPDAKQQASAHGIQLAISNPCFELWALIHYQDHTRYESGSEVVRLLKVHVPMYGKVLPCDELELRYRDAVLRARVLDQRVRSGLSDGNPSTGVHILTERIRALGRQQRS
jgi:hypothetical protein